MFLSMNRSQCGYTRDGSQKSGGMFLMVFSRGHELRAAVRPVRLRQCGHWMMGDATLAKQRVTVSGAYGDDGLPMDPDKLSRRYDESLPYPHYATTGVDIDAFWNSLIPIPSELTEVFWKGDGWNSSGSEGSAMRAWGRENMRSLRNAGK